ncbi:hypothetical protein GG344DRAFT_76265 [Lentinula edodes]|nr:hypothetical protein GG344DRAFT_76265 [Lentinula edodes]
MKIEWASDFHRDGSRRSHPIASTMHGWLAKMRGTLVGNEKLRSEGMREMRQAKANRKHRKQNKSQGKSSAKGGGFSLFGSGRKPLPQHRGSRNVTRGGHGGGGGSRPALRQHNSSSHRLARAKPENDNYQSASRHNTTKVQWALIACVIVASGRR